ncbi:hypothetical protein [Novosphingobium sp. Chol11]|uniref:hypothetical protein n=1 Tax=Novosphingobium sp. Chol11 TaxID=1385763 RepID=UPI001143CAD1|nr:hypothetical protein [Novosphingobium sp. Chol11]
MPSAAHVVPVSEPPELDPRSSEFDHAEQMVAWFYENFEDPANQLPYESGSGGYQWIWGGPYDAIEELTSAFPDASEKAIKAAVERLEASGVVEWSVNDSRIIGGLETTAEYDGSETRKIPQHEDRHRETIVETTLFPQRNFGWSVHVTFIPVGTNNSLSEVAASGFAIGDYGRDDYHFDSLRHLVKVLVGRQLEGVMVGDRPDVEEAYEWLNSLRSDADVFVDDGVIVHNSPPEWLQLRELFKHGTASGVAFISQSPGNWTGMLLMYGGSLLFLRLVKNINFVQDAFFERWAKRIKKGEFNPFE